MWGESGTNDITKTVVTPDSKIIYHDDSPDKNIYISWDGIKGSDGNTEGLEAVGTEDPNVDYSKGRYWNGLYQGQSNTTGYMPVWFNDGPIEEDYTIESLFIPVFGWLKYLKIGKYVGKYVFTITAKEGNLIFFSTKVGGKTIEFGGNITKSKGVLIIKNFDIDGALTNKVGIKGLKEIITDFGKQ